MLEEIFIMCFYGIIYLKIGAGEKKKIFFDFGLKNFFEVRPCRSIFWTILLRLFFFYYSHSSRYL